MTYIDAIHERTKTTDTIRIVERINGKRVFKELDPEYCIYTNSPSGEYDSIFGTTLEGHFTTKRGEFKALKEQYAGQTTYESDTNTLFRVLRNHYHGADSADLHVCFFDIEVDYDPEIGFAGPETPYAPINAISFHLGWCDELITLVVPPKTVSMDEAREICKNFGNTIVCVNERQMLEMFLEMTEDVDVFSGWNSTGYDIPYIVIRINKILGQESAKRLCHWGFEPKLREFEKFGKEMFTYDLIGKIHLDYLELYKKNTYQELHSYKLDFVGEHEVSEQKVVYEGSLAQLYNEDFEKFVEYNRQDTMLLVKIDRKMKFIELHNQLAHANSVDFKATMGSVAIIDQAIVNEAHERGKIVFDKRGFKQEGKAAGAYVRDPVVGLHDWVGAADINSLYPSAIRALNMSPDTIYGQVRQDMTNKLISERVAAGMSATEAWHEIFGSLEYQEIMKQSDVDLIVDIDVEGKPKQKSVTMTAKEIYEWIFKPDSNLSISANGTIFRTDVEGIIPGLLSRWYSDRKSMKKKAGEFFKKYSAEADEKQKALYYEQYVFWDMQQLIKKIQLNSLYGAILNEGSRFFDSRVGQSTTLTGRCIVRHMMATINEQLTGSYDHLGSAQVYGDTDSAYFSAFKAWSAKPTVEVKTSRDQFDEVMKIIQDVQMTGDQGLLLEVLNGLTDAQREAITMALNEEEMQSNVEEYDELADELDALIIEAFPKIAKAISLDENDAPREFGGAFGHLAETFEWTKDNVIKLYDDVCENMNATFPEFMDKSFNTGLERGAIIAAGREIIATRAMYIKKKRYAALVFDDEGKRYDVDNKPGKVKAMGLETKRSDTPAPVQNFLESILLDVLQGVEEKDVIKTIKDYRKEFQKWKGWNKGRPTAIKGLTKYGNKVQEVADSMKFDDGMIEAKGNGKVNMPGHVRASMNFNRMIKIMHDTETPEIRDGDKVIVCQLKQNPWNITSIARPVDIDEINLPDWFKEMPFDHAKMETAMIETKIENLIGILGWDLDSISDDSTFSELFTMDGPTKKKKEPVKPKKKKKENSLEGNDLFTF